MSMEKDSSKIFQWQKLDTKVPFNPNMMGDCYWFLQQEISTFHKHKNKYFKHFRMLLIYA